MIFRWVEREPSSPTHYCVLVCNLSTYASPKLASNRSQETHTRTRKGGGKRLLGLRLEAVACMHGHHIYNKSKDQQGKVANPARGRLIRENEYFPVPVRA